MSRLIEQYVDRLLTQSTPDAPLWNREQIRQGKRAHWNYIDGCMMTSLLRLHAQTGNEKYFQFVERFVDYYVFEDGSLRGYELETYNLDNICTGRVLFDLYTATGKEKYKRAIGLLYRQLMEQPRTAEGSFWHKQIYPHQVWLDGLYMAQVFYTRYETHYNGCRNYADILKQFQTVRARMFDEGKRLYYHGYDSEKRMFWANERGLSASFWLRAMGWYAVALVDVIDYLHADAAEERNALTPIFVELMEGIQAYIDPKTQMLYQVVDQMGKKGNYPETSGSSMMAYAMLKGVRTGLLNEAYREQGERMFQGICERYLSQKDGVLNLGGICLVAGLGPQDNPRRDGSYAYYISEPVVENDAKGLAPFLMCYVELQEAHARS